MNSTGGCQVTGGCGACWPLLATPVLRSWHQCSPLGPGASWQHLAISLLLALLPKQLCRLPTITISPWSRLTPEPLLRRLLVILGHGHSQDCSRVSQRWCSSIWPCSPVLPMPNGCWFALWCSNILFPDIKDFFHCLVGANFCETPHSIPVFSACVPWHICSNTMCVSSLQLKTGSSIVEIQPKSLV